MTLFDPKKAAKAAKGTGTGTDGSGNVFEMDSRRLKALMDALPVGVSFSEDTTCERVMGNPALLKQLGIPAGENISASTSDPTAAGHGLRHFINGKEVTGADLPMQRAIATGAEVPPMEIEVRMPDGRSWFMEASGAPVRDARGKVVASVAVNVDISERKNLEESRRARQKLEEEKLKADVLLGEERRRTNFIADAAHELRTPLAIIKGNLELAMRKGKAPVLTAAQAFKAINQEVEHLSVLLADLSMLTSDASDVGKKTALEHVDLVALAKDVAGRCGTLARKRHISIKVVPGKPVSYLCDKHYMQKLLTNLVSNAIAYGKEKGSVKVAIKANASEVLVTVSDNGIGIPKDHLPYVFDRFYRVNEGHSMGRFGHKGTGLGLSIVKWIAEAHGGRVGVASSKKGSTFTVTLPIPSQVSASSK